VTSHPATPAGGTKSARRGRPRHLHPATERTGSVAIAGRGPVRFALKRTFDLVGAVLLVVLLSPVLVGIALWLLVSNGRPVLYKQTRVGRHGRPFTMIKFRSMVHDAHDRRHDLREHNERNGPLFKIGEDPRVTKAGRFLRASSLDELPQLFNVIAGTMSLVGPRPALYEERESFPPELLAREQMRPGITGLWQIKARHDPDFDRYHELDLRYVSSWTLADDLSILARTPFVVAREFWFLRKGGGEAAGSISTGVVVETPDDQVGAYRR
jgi:lipopolysaccharide/colanic/teichoic acid biosynthesis glycosyltransferase